MASTNSGAFRLLQKTKPSGFRWWIIERRGRLWGWTYYDSFISEESARTTLENLRRGVREKLEVVDE